MRFLFTYLPRALRILKITQIRKVWRNGFRTEEGSGVMNDKSKQIINMKIFPFALSDGGFNYGERRYFAGRTSLLLIIDIIYPY